MPSTNTTLETEDNRLLPTTLHVIPDWERAPGKSVITTNQAALWAMLQIMREGEKLSGLGRPLMGMPAM